MPRMPDPPQNHFYQDQSAHGAGYSSQHYSHEISPLSTSNSGSPTSPSKLYHTRQVRPLYIPAVLRPTEHPSKVVKPKVDCKGDKGIADEDKVLRSSGSFISLPGLGSLGLSKLSRRSTGDSGKCIDGSWNLDLFPEVKGLPSRSHWKVRISTCLLLSQSAAVSWSMTRNRCTGSLRPPSLSRRAADLCHPAARRRLCDLRRADMPAALHLLHAAAPLPALR
jgi:hypothetical protein